MDPDALVLGVDLGTQQFKAMVVAATGQVVSRVVQPVTSHSTEPGMVEQDPAEWEELLWAVGRRAVEESGSAERIVAIGVTGHMHTLVPLDGQGAPVGRAIVWNDARAGGEIEPLRQFEPLWNPPIAAYTLPKLLWMRARQSMVFGRVRGLLFPKDYLRLCLTGQVNTDPSDASSSLAWDFEAGTWDRQLVSGLGLGDVGLPDVLPADTEAGTLGADAAVSLGLRSGIPVAAGAGDVASAVIGVGVLEPDAVLINAGTAAQVILLGSGNREELLHRRRMGRRVGYLFELGVERRLFLMGALPSAGHSLAWWKRLIGNEQTFEEFDANAADQVLEAEGALFLPYLQGTGTPRMVDGGLAGFVQMSATEDHRRLTRAVFEGVAMGLRQVVDAMVEDRPHASAVVVTGGLARSMTFCKVLCTLLHRPVVAFELSDASCLGAVTAALAVAGLKSSSAMGSQPATVTHEPSDEQVDRLEVRYERFVGWTRRFVDAHMSSP